MIRKILSFVLFLFIIPYAHSGVIEEPFDNDGRIISNEGALIAGGKLIPAQNIVAVETNVASCWRFDCAAGNTVADETARHSGLRENMEDADWITGVFTNALHFDGKNEFVVIPDDSAFNNLSEFTCEFWVKPHAQSPFVRESILHLPLDDNSANNIVFDEVQAHPGISSTNTDNLHTAGKIDGAFEFDGSVYIDVDNDTCFDDLSNTFSCSFWVNASLITNDAHRNIISKKGAGASIEIALGKDETDNEGVYNLVYIKLYDNDSEPFYMQPRYRVPADTWSHIAVVLNGRGESSLEVYVNGQKAQRILDSRLTFYADYTSGALTAEYSEGTGTCNYVCARNSRPASYCDENGIIRYITESNQPRFTHGYYDDTGYHELYGLLHEIFSTNQALYSSDFTVANWSKSGVEVIADQAISPDGQQTADKCVAEADNGTITQSYSLGTAKKLCFSIFIRGSASTTSAQITIDGGSNWKPVSLSATQWRRFQCYMTGTNPQFGVKLDNEGDEVYLWGAQLEEDKLFATSYIPTAGATVYRPHEFVNYFSEGNRNSSEETIYLEFAPEYFVDAASQLVCAPGLVANAGDLRNVFFGSQNGKHVTFKPNFTDSPACYAQTYAQQIQMWQLYSTTAICKHSVPFAQLYVDKILRATEDIDDYADPEFGQEFYIGHTYSGNDAFSGIIRRVVIFKESLTQQEVNRLNNYGAECFIGYDDTTELGSIANNNNIRIGENFTGKLDDIRIYDYALNKSEQRILYYPETGLSATMPIAHYKLNDNDNEQEVIDPVFGHSRAIAGSTTVSTSDLHTAGKIAGAFSFDGNVHIEIDNDAYFDDLSNTFSYSFWLNSPAITEDTQQSIISKKGLGASIEIALGKDETDNEGAYNLLYIKLYDNDSEPFYMQPRYRVPADVWVHIAVIANGRGESSLEVYVNSDKAQSILDSRLTFYADYTSGTLSAEYSSGSGTCNYTGTKTTSRPASYCDNDGIIRYITVSNQPRFTHGYYDDAGFHELYGLLYESFSTNQALYSSDFTVANWTKSNVQITADQVIGPDGTQTADKCVAEADNGTITQLYSIGIAKKLCFSIFIRGSATTISAQITIDGGSNWKPVSLSATQWRRFQCYMTGTNPEFGVKLDNEGDEVYLWGAQLEEDKLFATSYIPTTNASVYRYYEFVKYPCAGNRNPSEESIYLEFAPEYFVDAASQLVSAPGLVANDSDLCNVFFGSQNGKHVTFKPNYTDSPSCYAQTYAQQIQMWQLYSTTAICKHSVPFAQLYVDKVLRASEDVDDYIDPEFGQEFYIGHTYNGNDAFSGIIRRVVIFNQQLTQQEVNRLNDYGVESFIGYDDTTKLGSIANNNNIHIGENFTGKLDDIRIYDYALNIDSVEKLFNNGDGTELETVDEYCLVSKFDNDNDGSYRIYVNSYPQQVFAEIKTASGEIVTHTANGLSLNQWNHVAVTYDNDSLSIYINGEPDSSVSTNGESIRNSTADIKFGTSGTNDYWDGCLDEMIFRNEAISAQQISLHAHNFYPKAEIKGNLVDFGEDIANYESITVDVSGADESQYGYIWFGYNNDSMFNMNGEPENETNGFELSSGTNVIPLIASGLGGKDFFYKIVLITDETYSNACVQIESLELSFQEKDIDNDGLYDRDEKTIYHTNPNSSDTDGDGIDDLTEINSPYYDPFVINDYIDYIDNESIPAINMNCYRLGNNYLVVRGISSNERPVMFNFGNIEKINTKNEFSYLLKENECRVINNYIHIKYTNADNGAQFSEWDNDVEVIGKKQFKIISPIHRANISTKGAN